MLLAADDATRLQHLGIWVFVLLGKQNIAISYEVGVIQPSFMQQLSLNESAE
jgi:hypothetical protein